MQGLFISINMHVHIKLAHLCSLIYVNSYPTFLKFHNHQKLNTSLNKNWCVLNIWTRRAYTTVFNTFTCINRYLLKRYEKDKDAYQFFTNLVFWENMNNNPIYFYDLNNTNSVNTFI